MNFVNPQILCETSEELSFKINLDKFERLFDLTSSSDKVFSTNLKFFKEGEKLLVTGNLKGEIKLLCQRCLEDFLLNLDLNIKWNLVKEIQEKQETYKDFDELEISGARFSLLEALEDELIMAIPYASTCKDDGSCKLALNASQYFETDSEILKNDEVSNSPFAILKELKFKS